MRFDLSLIAADILRIGPGGRHVFGRMFLLRIGLGNRLLFLGRLIPLRNGGGSVYRLLIVKRCPFARVDRGRLGNRCRRLLIGGRLHQIFRFFGGGVRSRLFDRSWSGLFRFDGCGRQCLGLRLLCYRCGGLVARRCFERIRLDSFGLLDRRQGFGVFAFNLGDCLFQLVELAVDHVVRGPWIHALELTAYGTARLLVDPASHFQCVFRQAVDRPANNCNKIRHQYFLNFETRGNCRVAAFPAPTLVLKRVRHKYRVVPFRAGRK